MCAVQSRNIQVPRLPLGVESGCSGFSLPLGSLKASVMSAAGNRRAPKSLFPAGRGRTGKGLREEVAAGNG
jgi:hypothetical protein